MATSESQKRASTKWNKNQDSITLRPPKEVGKQIRQAAEKAGKRVSPFVVEIVLNYLEKEEK